MEYVLLKKALSVCEAVFEGSSEQPCRYRLHFA